MSKVAFGTITRELINISPYIEFLKNAEKHGHEISHLIIGYNNFVDPLVVEELNKYTEVITVQSGNTDSFIEHMEFLPLNDDEIHDFLGESSRIKYNKCSFGTCRNTVLLAALALEIDYLIFFDTDVLPYVLKESEENQYTYYPIDYVGSHLSQLDKKNKIVASTSGYTGYYYIPKMNYPGFYDLLRGIQNEDMYDFVTSSKFIKPFIQNKPGVNIRKARKVFGGNLSLDLRQIEHLSPFFSATLIVENSLYLGRGEDTFYSTLLKKFGGTCVNNDTRIFHNSFHDFPNIPDAHNQKNIDMFYQDCMGWLIRNPFMNWINKKYGVSTKKINSYDRYKSLVSGSEATVEFFNDNRFFRLPVAYELAERQLSENIRYYEKLLDVWKTIQKQFSRS